MMREVMNQALCRRAEGIADRIGGFLPMEGRLLDIGSGTGHNAQAIRSRTELEVAEIDVTDMNAVGRPPLLFDGLHIPLADGAVDCGLMLFILHYPEDPEGLLREAHRVIKGRLIVLQSTYSGETALRCLRCRDFFQGRFAFKMANRLGIIGGDSSALHPSTFFDRRRLERIFKESRWRIAHHSPARWPGVEVSRDLYVLERQ